MHATTATNLNVATVNAYPGSMCVIIKSTVLMNPMKMAYAIRPVSTTNAITNARKRHTAQFALVEMATNCWPTTNRVVILTNVSTAMNHALSIAKIRMVRIDARAMPVLVCPQTKSHANQPMHDCFYSIRNTITFIGYVRI